MMRARGNRGEPSEGCSSPAGTAHCRGSLAGASSGMLRSSCPAFLVHTWHTI